MTAHIKPTKYDPAKIYAVIADEDGFVIEPEEVEVWASDPDDEDGQEPANAYLVTGSAIPRSQSDREEGIHRMPGSYRSLDIIAEHDLYGAQPDEIVARMRQLIALAETSQAEPSGQS